MEATTSSSTPTLVSPSLPALPPSNGFGTVRVLDPSKLPMLYFNTRTQDGRVGEKGDVQLNESARKAQEVYWRILGSVCPDKRKPEDVEKSFLELYQVTQPTKDTIKVIDFTIKPDRSTITYTYEYLEGTNAKQAEATKVLPFLPDIKEFQGLLHKALNSTAPSVSYFDEDSIGAINGEKSFEFRPTYFTRSGEALLESKKSGFVGKLLEAFELTDKTSAKYKEVEPHLKKYKKFKESISHALKTKKEEIEKKLLQANLSVGDRTDPEVLQALYERLSTELTVQNDLEAEIALVIFSQKPKDSNDSMLARYYENVYLKLEKAYKESKGKKELDPQEKTQILQIIALSERSRRNVIWDLHQKKMGKNYPYSDSSMEKFLVTLVEDHLKRDPSSAENYFSKKMEEVAFPKDKISQEANEFKELFYQKFLA